MGVQPRKVPSWSSHAPKDPRRGSGTITSWRPCHQAHKPFERPVRLPWHSCRRTLQARTLQILKNHCQPTPASHIIHHLPSSFVCNFFSVFSCIHNLSPLRSDEKDLCTTTYKNMINT